MIAINLSTGEKLTFNHNDVNRAFCYIAASYPRPICFDPNFDHYEIRVGQQGAHMGDWSIPNANN